jgi:adenylate cyclase
MSDVFISYARSTEKQAEQVAEALRSLGYNIWRDDELPAHRAYTEVIEERLKAAKAVVVIWSAEAVKSQWVRAEADIAREAGTLVQLRVDGSTPPLPFNQIQCAELAGWNGDTGAPGWRKVVASVADLVGGTAAPTAGAPLPLPSKPSVAVMPFANLSGDPEQDYFADGMVEEIVAGLTRYRSIFVIASSSTFSFKGTTVSPQEVARQLGVRYLLQGSVRKAGGRVRIAVNLIDAADGAQIWADRFEDTVDDVFVLQDRVALSVAGVIEPAVKQAETRRALLRPTDSLGGYDLYLHALVHYRTQERDSTLRALDMLDRAIALDPAYGSALALAASCRSRLAARGWTDDASADRDRGVVLARQALLVGGDDPDVLVRAASVLSQDSGEDVSSLFDRAVALNPGSASARLLIGDHHLRAGNADLAAEHIEASMRLDPFSPSRPVQLGMLGTALFFQGRGAQAVAALREAALLIPNNPYIQILLTACYAQSGDEELAAQSLRRFRSLLPPEAPTTDAIQAQIKRNFRNPEQRRRLLDGIAAAEGKTPTDTRTIG